MADDKEPATPAGAEGNAGEMSEAEIDQNLADTFPASDPPSWTLGTNHSEVPRSKSSEAEEDAKED
ncbi:MAG: hypothetical protein H7Z16_13440 [Pyrinomonadaceae bacterium]|nr:hypothetical protein [Pyrinomonadaceae bacterium]